MRKKEELIELLALFLENAPSIIEIHKMEKKGTKAKKDFLKGEIDSNKLEEIMGEIIKASNPMVLQDLNEMKVCLELLKYPVDKAKEELEHEQDHYNEAIKHGCTCTFQLKFFRNEEGQLGFIPSVIAEFDQDEDEEKMRQTLREIISAPCELSPTDEESLK